ncbi:arrestin domain-containing protein 3-like isoform X3 [Amphiura filiformis]|uniref:arrestin domain-containing protein 3-like isoform X3 n=1 Tax=Amphiura filiformis TaxID=82378 RepID=UPI003B21B823
MLFIPRYRYQDPNRRRRQQSDSSRRNRDSAAAIANDNIAGNMVKLKDFHIILDNNKTVYSAGEYVSGHVVVELRGDMKMRGIRVYMRGLAKVHWSESRGGGHQTGSYTKYYDAEEEYFYMKQVLFGKDEHEGGSNPVLRAGHHELRFSFQIPYGRVATSFEGKYGRIRYWLKAEVDKPWGFNSKTKRAFTVIDHIDINTSALLAPQTGFQEKTVCCGLCVAGNISMSIKTDRKGYCPGESIAISSEFQNQSGRRIKPRATLYQRTTFFADGKSRSVRNAVATLQGNTIRGRRTETWSNKLLKIPPITPTLTNCGIIKLEYFLTICLDITGAMNLYLHLPVVVGTVPLRAPPYTPFDPMSLGGMELNFSAMFGGTTIGEVPPNYAPPSYAECVFGAVDIRDDETGDMMGDTLFTPMYTYVPNYEFRQPPPPYSVMDPNASLSQGIETYTPVGVS